LQLSYFKAKLALLLKISQTRFGANAIINVGLFQSIRESGLFSMDPDLGAGM
jgi:nuclear pore complex protein Nup205